MVRDAGRNGSGAVQQPETRLADGLVGPGRERGAARPRAAHHPRSLGFGADPRARARGGRRNAARRAVAAAARDRRGVRRVPAEHPAPGAVVLPVLRVAQRRDQAPGVRLRRPGARRLHVGVRRRSHQERDFGGSEGAARGRAFERDALRDGDAHDRAAAGGREDDPAAGQHGAQPHQELVAGQHDLRARRSRHGKPDRRANLSVRPHVRRRRDLLPDPHPAGRVRGEPAREAVRALMDLGWLFNRGTLTFIAGGLLVTLEVAAISIALSFVAGVALALGRLSRLAPLRAVATAYIEGMRALPVLLVIFFSYFALPRIIGVKLDPFAAGVIGLSAFTAALVAEIVRAGILAVPKGLIEAAESQGFSGGQILRIITLPIALRQMMPALVAQFVTLLKDTSLTAVIGILELTRRGQIVFAQPPFQPIPVFALLALIYFTA